MLVFALFGRNEADRPLHRRRRRHHFAQRIEVSMYVVRAFVQLRELAANHRDLAKRLDTLEEKTEALALQHDTFSRNTRVQLKRWRVACSRPRRP